MTDMEFVMEDDGLEDLDSSTDVMKDYCEENEDRASPIGKDIFDGSSSESETAITKINRKKFSMPSHINTVGEPPSICYQCTVCNSYFSHKLTARNHEFCASGKKPFKCKLCDKRFVKKCDRDNHYKIHSGERPFNCPACDKTFHLKHKLSRHLRTHSGVKGSYKCSTCPRSFISKEALRKHEVNKHNSSQTLQCKKCKQFFGKQEERTKHICKAPTKNQVVCEICGKMFSKHWNLTVHLRIHGGQKPYECEVCQKKFRLRQHLERHSSKHQTDADFECTLCQQTFRRKDNMIRHLKLNHPGKHLSGSLNEIAKRSKKPPTVKLSKRVETSSLGREPTIIINDHFPNIRFAKKASGVDVQTKPSGEPYRWEVDNTARKTNSSGSSEVGLNVATNAVVSTIRGNSEHDSPSYVRSNSVRVVETRTSSSRRTVDTDERSSPADVQRCRQVSVLRYTSSQKQQPPTPNIT